MNCPICNLELKKYGFTSAGKQRYNCSNCGFVRVLPNPAVNEDIARLEAWIRRLERKIENLEADPR
jgi:transposase-like protein